MAVYFDLENEIPEGATVLDAKFRIYRYDTWEKTHRIDGWYSAYKITNGAWVSQVTNTTYLKPWNNKGGDYTGEGADTMYQTLETGWFEFDITSHVQDFVNEPSKNYGIMFSVAMDNPNHCYSASDPKEDTVAQVGKFHSMKASDVSLRPQLVITYDMDPTGIAIAHKKGCTDFQVRQADGTIQVRVPNLSESLVRVSDVRGRKIAVCTLSGCNKWVSVPLKILPGAYLVSVTHGGSGNTRMVTVVK